MAYQDNNDHETYEGTVKHETELAKLVDFGGEAPVWVPKSLIREESATKTEGLTSFLLPTWWAVREGLE